MTVNGRRVANSECLQSADVNATDVYPDNSGNSDSLCAMSPGDSAQFVSSKPDEDRWLNFSAITGDCGGRSGWVWKGDNGGDMTVQ